ncbi:MAG: ABC transporter permease [Alphaproteobacteria bacterium]|nr:ABC transporter permease [Alphaproteobacteria bacterium]
MASRPKAADRPAASSLLATLWARSSRVRTVLTVLVATVIVWELVCRLLALPPILLPAPTLVFVDLMKSPDWILIHTGYTLFATLAGFALAVIIGIALAVGIVYSPLLERTLYTLLVAFNSLPKVALAPLFIIWLGTGMSPKIAIALVIAIFAIVIDMVLGLRSVDPDMLDLAKTCNASPLQTLMKIRFPNALPSLFAGMKVAISLALVGAIVGEFVAADRGLGYVILSAQGLFDTTRMFSGLVVLGVLGTILFFLIDLAERLMLPWHVSRRSEAAPAPRHTP